MTIGTGLVFEDTDFTGVYNKINGVYGRNDNGYGQVLASNPAANGVAVTSADWNNLRTYCVNTRIHQAGSSSPTSVSSGAVIQSALVTELDTLADTCTTNRYSIAAGQFTADEAKSSATRQSSVSGTWGVQSSFNHVLTATCTVTGADMNSDGPRRGLRYFFNAGGKVKLAISLANFTGGVSGKGQKWADLFSGAGTIYMDYTQTLCTGTGTTSTVGGLDLTLTDQQIFRKDVGSGVYSENYFLVYARFFDVNQTGIIFTVKCYDMDTGDQQAGFLPGPAVDEAVDGNLTVAFTQDRPSGSYVSITTPTYSAVTFSTGTS
jgi:hypothetical protein